MKKLKVVHSEPLILKYRFANIYISLLFIDPMIQYMNIYIYGEV